MKHEKIETFLDELLTKGKALQKNDDRFVRDIGTLLLQSASVITNQHNYIAEAQEDITLLSGKDFNNHAVVTNLLREQNELLTAIVELRQVVNEKKENEEDLEEELDLQQKAILKQLGVKFQGSTPAERVNVLMGTLLVAADSSLSTMGRKIAGLKSEDEK